MTVEAHRRREATLGRDIAVHEPPPLEDGSCGWKDQALYMTSAVRVHAHTCSVALGKVRENFTRAVAGES